MVIEKVPVAIFERLVNQNARKCFRFAGQGSKSPVELARFSMHMARVQLCNITLLRRSRDFLIWKNSKAYTWPFIGLQFRQLTQRQGFWGQALSIFWKM